MLEELVAGKARGLLLVRDSVTCEGRSLLRAFASAAAQRSEKVFVVLFEVSQEQFEAGLSPTVRQRLQFHDGFTDPLGWSRPDSQLGGNDLGLILAGLGGSQHGDVPLMVVLDSLSWLLLRLPPTQVCQALGALLGGTPKAGVPPQVLALLHQELHPPGLLQALEGLASIQLILWGTHQLGSPCLVTISSPPRRGGGTHKDETFTVRPDGSLGVAPPFPKLEEMGGWSSGATLGTPQGGGGRTPPHPLTFRLQLSAAERAARAALTPPYQLSPTRKSLLLAPGTFGCDSEPPQDEDFEDPDDDLDV